MECPKCKVFNPDNLKKCLKCGSPLSDIGLDHEFEEEHTIFESDSFVREGSYDPNMEGPHHISEQFETRFEIGEKIGSGGFSNVYLARDLKVSKRKVAIKEILFDKVHKILNSQDIQIVKSRIMNEVKTMAILHHPNIVTIFDTQETEEKFSIVMEYIDGGTLRNKVKQQGVLSPAEVADIGAQLCEGLVEIHQAGIVHRDIKPENILLTSRGMPKLADFGTAQELQSGNNFPRGLAGTYSYMSPEQKNNSTSVDARSDIYSLGATIYFTATGNWSENFDVSILPDLLREPIAKALHENPQKRFQTAAEFSRALKEVCRKIENHGSGNQSTGGYLCYGCGGNTVQPTSVYCNKCGCDLVAVRRDMEENFKSVMKKVDSYLEQDSFANASQELIILAGKLSHEHFTHLLKQVQERQDTVHKENERAKGQLTQMEDLLQDTQMAFDGVDFSAAEKCIQEIKSNTRPYCRSVIERADKIAERIKQVPIHGEKIKIELNTFIHGSSEGSAHYKGEAARLIYQRKFDECQKLFQELKDKTDKRFYPEIAKQIEFHFQWFKEEKNKIESICSAAEKDLAAAQDALGELDLEKAEKNARQVIDSASIETIKPLYTKAKEILDRITVIKSIREELNCKLEEAISLSKEHKYKESLVLIDSIFNQKDDIAFQEQQQRATQEKERIQKEMTLYERKLVFENLLSEAKGNQKNAKTILSEILSNEDVELADQRKQARDFLKRRKRRFIGKWTFRMLVPMLIFGYLGYPHFILSNKDASIIGDLAYIRTAPRNDSQVLLTLHRNSKVKIRGIVPGSDSAIWIKVETLEEKQQGYIIANGLLTNNLPLFGKAIVIREDSKIMEDHSFSSKMVESVAQFDIIKITGWATDNSSHVWYKAQINGKQGYIPEYKMRFVKYDFDIDQLNKSKALKPIRELYEKLPLSGWLSNALIWCFE